MAMLLPAKSSYVADSLEVEMLEGERALIASLAPEWEALCDASDDLHRLLRPAFVEAYIASFAPEDRVLILTARKHGQLVALLPLVERAVGVGPVRFRWLHSAWNSLFPRFDAVSLPELREQVAVALWRHLRRRSQWDLVQIDPTPMGGVVDRMRLLAEQEGVASHVHRMNNTPFITLQATGTLEEVIASQKRKLRSHVRVALKRLEARGTVQFIDAGWDDSAGDLEHIRDQLYEIEHRSWKGGAGTSILSVPHAHAFFDRLSTAPEFKPFFHAMMLKCGDDIVSASIGLSSGSTHFGLKIAFNDAYRECSPGHLLVLHEIHALGRRGYREFDLGGSADPYKMAWTSTSRPFASVFLFHPGPRGRLEHDLLFNLGPDIRKFLGSNRSPRLMRRLLE